MNSKVLAIILGGGQGTRLAPLTTPRSKPAVPVAGKYRIVDIPISNCINNDIGRIFVLTQFNSASLNGHIKNSYNFSLFSDSFVDILAAEQTPRSGSWFQGTADAVRKCMHHFLNHEFDYALILSGDQLYQMDLNELVNHHINKKADITIATQPVSALEASDFGILKTKENGNISEFIEKPSQDIVPEWKSPVSESSKNQGKEYLASMGIYVFNRDLLVELMNDETTTDFGKEIIPQAIGKRKVLSYQYEGYWTDIGTIKSFFEANLDLASDIPKFNFFDNKKVIYTRARLLPPSKISGTTLEKTVIAEGSIIHASRIENSVIGIRSRIGKGSTIVNSIVMGCDYYQDLEQLSDENRRKNKILGIGERCYINNTIIDKNCIIGNNVNINGGEHLDDTDNKLYTVTDGVVVVKKGAIIPSGFSI